MKKIYLLLLLIAGCCLAACEEKDAAQMFVDVNFRIVPEDSTLELVRITPSRIELTDMNFVGQKKLRYSCQGDTCIHLVKSFYDIQFEGKIFYRNKGGNTLFSNFRSIGNFQQVIIRDTTIEIPVNPM